MPAQLVQVLIAQGLLPRDKAEAALRHQAAQGGGIDTALLELRLVSEQDVLQALGGASGMKPVNLADFEPNADVAAFIPPKIAERLCVVPLSLDGSTLHVACGYPVPAKDLEEVGFLLGKPLELWVAIEVRVREWISVIYRQPFSPRYAQVLASLEPERGGGTQAPPPPPAAPAPKPTASEEDALSLDLVERLARSVAGEPIVREPKEPARPAEPPAAAPKPAGAPAAPPAQAQRPAPPAAPAAKAPPAPAPAAIPPPAYTREPLRLNMPASPAPVPAAMQPAAPRPAPTAPPAAQPPAPKAAPAPQAPPAPAPKAAPPPAPQAAPAPKAAPAPQAPPAPKAAPQAPPAPKAAPAPQAPPAPAPKAAPAPAQEELPEWTLAQARAAIKEASRDRDKLIDTILRFGRRTFDFVASFAVLRGAAEGWEARGEGADPERFGTVSIPLDASSVFRTVAITRGSYTGPLPPDSLTKPYLELFGRQAARTVFLYPVEVRGRLVAILYGDSGQKPISQRRLSDFIIFCQELPGAFQDLILFRKQRVSEPPSRGGLDFDVDVDVEAPAAPSTPAPPRATATGLGWSPFVTRSANTPGRAASMAPLVQSQEERPPPDFGPLLKRLTGPDAAQRANAMAELARTPEASAKALAAQFPGPTAWSRLPVVELPEADELGPIPAALSRLGRPAAQALAPLLDSGDADTRYFALLTAGNLPFVELVDGVLRGLFDYEPDLSSAARVAAAAIKHLPRLDAAKRDLRQELTSRDALRRSLAARALGTLHDRESIEGLILLTGSDDEMCAQAGAEALREVTRATLGLDQRAWMAWWAENRGRRRADWLVAALRHPELDMRLAAIEELTRALNNPLGYYADAPEPEREAAVRRWEAAAADPAHARRLSLL